MDKKNPMSIAKGGKVMTNESDDVPDYPREAGPGGHCLTRKSKKDFHNDGEEVGQIVAHSASAGKTPSFGHKSKGTEVKHGGPEEAAALATSATTDAGSKKKRRRPGEIRKKPIDMPRRPLSAYNIFFREERARLVIQRQQAQQMGLGPTKQKGKGDNASALRAETNADLFAAMGKTIASRWNHLKPEDKVNYEREAADEQNRYKEEMKVYREGQKVRKEEEAKKIKISAVAEFAGIKYSLPVTAHDNANLEKPPDVEENVSSSICKPSVLNSKTLKAAPSSSSTHSDDQQAHLSTSYHETDGKAGNSDNTRLPYLDFAAVSTSCAKEEQGPYHSALQDGKATTEAGTSTMILGRQSSPTGDNITVGDMDISKRTGQPSKNESAFLSEMLQTLQKYRENDTRAISCGDRTTGLTKVKEQQKEAHQHGLTTESVPLAEQQMQQIREALQELVKKPTAASSTVRSLRSSSPPQPPPPTAEAAKSKESESSESSSLPPAATLQEQLSRVFLEQQQQQSRSAHAHLNSIHRQRLEEQQQESFPPPLLRYPFRQGSEGNTHVNNPSSILPPYEARNEVLQKSEQVLEEEENRRIQIQQQQILMLLKQQEAQQQQQRSTLDNGNGALGSLPEPLLERIFLLQQQYEPEQQRPTTTAPAMTAALREGSDDSSIQDNDLIMALVQHHRYEKERQQQLFQLILQQQQQQQQQEQRREQSHEPTVALASGQADEQQHPHNLQLQEQQLLLQLQRELQQNRQSSTPFGGSEPNSSNPSIAQQLQLYQLLQLQQMQEQQRRSDNEDTKPKAK